MSIESLREAIPDYAKDIRINLGTIITAEGAPDLSDAQRYAVLLASAYATRSAAVIQAVEADATSLLSAEYVTAARAAASIMAMNNIYYRFVHLVNDAEIRAMPAKLRMNVIGNPGIAKLDFELMSLAVSAINGCGMCLEAHLHEVVKGGISKLGAQSAIRIAAILNATAQSIVYRA